MVRAITHHLMVSGDYRPTPDDLAPCLAPRFLVAPGARRRTVRRTWLDTFDWRLYRAGMTLVDVSDHGRRQNLLTDGDDNAVASHAGPVRWPALVHDLPAGPLRSALEPVMGVRAVAPTTRAVSDLQTLRVLNCDAKTVAWLTIEAMTVPQAGADAVPPLITVAPVRGYQSEADRVAQRLAAAPMLARPATSALVMALAATGRCPQDYTGRVDVTLSAQMPSRRAVAAVLLRLVDILEANVPGALGDVDTEFLHDLRVAVRRTRAALKLAGDVLPPGLAGRYRPEFKWLGDATTPTRDLDVYLLNYGPMAAGLVAADPADLAPLHAYLRRRRGAERRRLTRVLRSSRFGDLTRTWRGALVGLPADARGSTAGSLAANRIRRAHRRVLALGSAITDDSPPGALHELRKRCKELRYALEFFASLHDEDAHRQVVDHLKGLQDCLGEFQDSQVQRLELQMFATQMTSERQVPASALLAMGELAAQLALRQRSARREFAGRFAAFASKAVRRHVAALTAGSGA